MSAYSSYMVLFDRFCDHTRSPSGERPPSRATRGRSPPVSFGSTEDTYESDWGIDDGAPLATATTPANDASGLDQPQTSASAISSGRMVPIGDPKFTSRTEPLLPDNRPLPRGLDALVFQPSPDPLDPDKFGCPTWQQVTSHLVPHASPEAIRALLSAGRAPRTWGKLQHLALQCQRVSKGRGGKPARVRDLNLTDSPVRALR